MSQLKVTRNNILLTGEHRELSVEELRLCFFDIGVCLYSDTMSFIHFMRLMYPRFLVADFSPLTQTVLEFHFYTQAANPWGKPVFVSAGEVWPFDQEINPFGYVYDAILTAVLGKVQQYLLVHAGVVSRDRGAILIAGDSGHGKTTLVLELVKRGYHFLSDELAPISRGDHHVAPFPRSLRLRPGSLELAGLPTAPAEAPIWYDKNILDIDQIVPGSLGEPARIVKVIILKEPDAGEGSPSDDKELGVFLNRMDGTLLEAVGKIDSVTRVWQTVELGYPVLRLRAARRMQVLAKIEALCKERRILVIDVSKRRLAQPSFTEPASLSRIPKSQAALELIRQYQPAHKSILLSEAFQGDSTKLFLELIEALRGADCYQVKPGPLGETADLIDR